MSQTITVSDAAYANLLSKARAEGYDSVDAFVEYAPESAFTLRDIIQQEISEEISGIADSATLVPEDRER